MHGIYDKSLPGKFTLPQLMSPVDNPALDNLLVYTYCQGMNLKNRSEYLSFRSMLALLGKLPPSQASSVLAGLGRFSGGILRIRRRVVEDQLGIVFPDLSAAGRGALANRIYDHLGRTVGEVFGSGMDVLVKNARIEPGWDRVDQALAFGRGAIVATGHIGNFELGGALIASRYPLLDVVKNQRNTEFNTYLERLRNERGIQTVSMQQPGRAVLNHLRSGGLVSLLVDQDAGAAGIGTDFLGRPASTWPGAARFSIRTGCPVIPMAILREGPGRHVLRISEPLEPSGLTDRPEDIISYTARISVAVEEFIWQNPEQWFWVHRRWKGAKAGVES